MTNEAAPVGNFPNLRGYVVESLQVTFALTIRFTPGRSADDVLRSCALRIETPFLFVTEAGSQLMDPEGDRALLGPVLRVFDHAVQSNEVTEGGSFQVAFEDGTKIVIDPDSDFEAWSLSGPAGSLIMALPGGGVAIFGKSDEPLGDRSRNTSGGSDVSDTVQRPTGTSSCTIQPDDP